MNFQTHSAATDPKADAIPYVVTPEIAELADQARPWVKWIPIYRNALERGTPRPAALETK